MTIPCKCLLLCCIILLGSTPRSVVFAQQPTLTPSFSPTLNNNTNSTDLPLNTTVPTSSPVNATTPIPTLVPTMAPVPNTTAPTNVPTTSPTQNVTAMPSDVASEPPTMNPTSSPTTSPKPTPAIIVPTIPPTAMPTVPPTISPTATPQALTLPPVVTEKVDESIMNVQIKFNGIGTITASDLLLLQTAMEVWFENYFNEILNTTSTRRNRHNRKERRQLQAVRQPAVRNMNTVYDVTNQDATTSGANTVTYTQNLVYDATSTSNNAEYYALAPFADSIYKGVLLKDLQENINSFNSLSAISTPVIAEPVPEDNGDGGLSLPIIIAIAAGGAFGLLLLAGGFYALGSRRDDRYPVSDGPNNNNNGSNLNSGYMSADDHDNMLPSTFQMSIGEDDIISTMDDPTVAKISNTMSGGETSALGGYGDQSVATVDYDYSKAYGGGGGESVVSSVGGTLGDATRQTAGEVAASGRLALGASYDDNNLRDSSSRIPREQVIVVEAPAGKLGVVIDTPDDGAPVVHAVKDTSVIANKIQVGDKLIKVDDEDVRSMTAIKVSKLISKKSANPVRRLTIVRTTHTGN